MITLREISREDIPAINRWRHDPFVSAGVGGARRFIGVDVDMKWYDDYLARRGTDVRCAVCLADGGTLVGMVSLTRIDPIHRHAEFHIVIGERASQNRGLGTAATRAMVRHGFRDLNLHRIYVSILKGNISSIRTCEKAGFRHVRDVDEDGVPHRLMRLERRYAH